MMDPQTFLRLKAINKLGLEKEFPFVTNENAFFDLFAPTGSRTRRKKREAEFAAAGSFGDMVPLQTENEVEGTYYRPRIPLYPTRPQRHYAKQRVPQLPVSKKPATAEPLNDLIKQVKNVMAQVQPNPSRIYVVEIDGKLVEMTESEYRIFDLKRKEKQLPPGR